MPCSLRGRGIFGCEFASVGLAHFFQVTEELAVFWTRASVDATRTIVATGSMPRLDEEHGTVA